MEDPDHVGTIRLDEDGMPRERTYVENLLHGLADFADFGIFVGFTAYFILELRNTGSFGFQSSSYTTFEETRAGVILGIAAAFGAAGFLMLLPIGHTFGSSRPRKAVALQFPAGSVEGVGIDGGEPSPRPLAPLILAELRGYVITALMLGAGALVLNTHVSRFMPVLEPVVYPAALLTLLMYLWSRVARLQRLCQTGTEVEGHLVGIDVGRERQMLARYEYEFRGRTRRVTNDSWLGRRAAVRHGERIIVLLDPLKPEDAVILRRLPSAWGRSP